MNNSLGFLPLLYAGVVGGWRARLGQQTSSLARGKSAGASSDLLLLHIYVKLNSSNSSGMTMLDDNCDDRICWLCWKK